MPKSVKGWVVVAVLAVLAAALPAEDKGGKNDANTPKAPRPPAWFTSVPLASVEATKTQKLILADFTGSDWCGWCQKLKAEVFDTKEFQDWAAKSVVLLELDFPRTLPQDDATKKQNAEMAKKCNVEGFPTIVFLKADGTEAGRAGYLEGGPKAWIATAQKILDGAAKQEITKK